MKHSAPLLALSLLVLAGCTTSTNAPLAGPAWFQLDDKAPESDVLTGYVLRAGRIGEATRVGIELPPETFAEGPYALADDVTGRTSSLVLFGHNDGDRSVLEVVDVDTGERRVIVESSMVLRRAMIDVETGDLYVLVLDQETRLELGVYRFDARRAGQTLEQGELMLPGIAREKEGQELYGPTFATLLAIDRSNGALVVQSCGEILCRTRSLDFASGAVTMRDEIGQGEMLGVVDGTLVTYEAGNGWPCKVYAIDVATGAARTLAHAYGATMRSGALVYESGDEPGLLLSRPVNAPDDVPPTMLGVFEVTAGDDDALHPVMDPARSLAGVDLPEGLVALGGDGRVSRVGKEPDAFFVRLDDGALFQAAHSLSR